MAKGAAKMTEKIGAILSGLQYWYIAQCNGDWEKRFGVRIGTIDNPGWSIRIDLTDTSLENKKFEDLRIDTSEDNWVLLWIKDKIFQGGGAPQNLVDLINTFLMWVDKSVLPTQNLQKNNDLLMRLQDWYKAQCDGDWEHEYGIKMNTIDNPGWLLQIDLIGTTLEGKAFERIKRTITEDNWMHCWVAEKQFQASGGPSNLIDLVKTFIEWAQSESHD
jgi:hypothetical protein